MRKFLIVVALLSGGCRLALAQQILAERKEEVAITKKALDQIYNFNFDSAEATISALQTRTGEHPAISLLHALHVYWKNLPLEKGSDAYFTYQKLLNKTAEQAEDYLAKDDENLEGVFFSLAAYGYLASFYAEEGSILKAIDHARKAYSSLKKGFKLKEEFNEFYFTTGLYNYYREKYPENHPAYKSFAWIFASGDKKLGLDQLRTAATEALFTGVEAFYYLFHIHLRYEKDPEAAMGFSRKLVEKHPGNLAFQAYHAEALAATGHYTEAGKIAQRLIDSNHNFYLLPGSLLTGIVLEKRDQEYELAEEYYRRAIEITKNAGFDTNHYASMAWAGLARIEDRRGNKSKAREYYSKALQLSGYDIVTDEAKEYLR